MASIGSGVSSACFKAVGAGMASSSPVTRFQIDITVEQLESQKYGGLCLFVEFGMFAGSKFVVGERSLTRSLIIFSVEACQKFLVGSDDLSIRQAKVPS